MTLLDRILSSTLAFGARLITGVAISGHPAEDATPTIYIANHSSHLDFIVLWSALPSSLRQKTRPVAAADYWARGLKRYFATHVFRAILVERNAERNAQPDPTHKAADEAIHHMSEPLEQGDSLILFPEGTRGDGVDVAPFRSGLFFLATAVPRAHLVPVYLENLSRVLPKGEFLPIPLVCRLRFGQPTSLLPGESKPDFLTRAHQLLCDLRETT